MNAGKLALGLIGASFYCGVVLADTAVRDYDSLILQARQGNYAPALAMLRQRSATHPHDSRAAYDHILIAGWAGRAQEAIAAYEDMRPAPRRLPADVLSALARAYRDAGRWDEALLHYRGGKLRYPNHADFSAGEIMTLADAGRVAQAIGMGESLVRSRPADLDARIALAYAFDAKGSPHDALEISDQALNMAPDNRHAAQQYIVALQQARLPRAALALAMRKPELASSRQLRALQADRAAEMTRLAAAPAQDRAHQFQIAGRAIAAYDGLISDWAAREDVTQPELERLRADRLQALHARMRMQEVVDGYEAMLARGVTPPRYVLSDVADAYLHLRQPDVAARLYGQLVMDDESQHDTPLVRITTQTGLYYSLIEDERFDPASAVIERARQEHPRWRHVKGWKLRIPNNLHLYAEHTSALNDFYSDNYPEAQRRLVELTDAAPNNVDLRADLADLYRSRGLPRQAEQELKLAETLEPRAADVIALQGTVALDQQEWRQAETLAQYASERYPEHAKTQQLQRDWDRYKKAALYLSAEHGNASGASVSGSPRAGTNDLRLQATLYTAPIAYDWRAFAGAGYASGKFEDVDRDARWAQAGVQYRARNLTAELEANVSRYGFGDKPGMRVQADYQLNDQWQLGAGLELRAHDIDLRALSNDISANRITAYVRWRPNELRDWTLGFAPMRYSDGNQRLSIALNGRERIYTSPHLKADLGLSISASRNNKDDAPYFNPRSDLDVMPTLQLTHTLYRRYETSVEQTFVAGAGLYAQQGYATAMTAELGYGIRYRSNDRFEIGLNVTGRSRPYDGVRERQLRVMLSLNLRF